jgi:hypothetical protein
MAECNVALRINVNPIIEFELIGSDLVKNVSFLQLKNSVNPETKYFFNSRNYNFSAT